MNLTIKGGTFIDALHEAAVIAEQQHLRIAKVRTRRSRTFLQPEKVTSKSGNRVFGAERLRPVVNGSIIRRTFVFAPA